MTAGSWFAQVHPAGGEKPEEPVYFLDFAATMTFVKAFSKRASGDILRVHVPAETTDQERQKLRESGAILV